MKRILGESEILRVVRLALSDYLFYVIGKRESDEPGPEIIICIDGLTGCKISSKKCCLVFQGEKMVYNNAVV